MTYRHSIIAASPDMRRLARKTAAVADLRLKLSYTPWTSFFVEDMSGTYERPFRVAGFIDYGIHANQLDVFVRAGLSAQKTAGTIFHECYHLAEYQSGLFRSLNDAPELRHAISELRADRFARSAPSGAYQDIMAALDIEIQEYLGCNGDEKMILAERKRKAGEVIERFHLDDVARMKARYASDDSDDDADDDDWLGGPEWWAKIRARMEMYAAIAGTA